MKDISEILRKHEGRQLEFKEKMPSRSDLAKTIVAFANDAGGDLYIGINNQHVVSGLSEAELVSQEEQISNLIYDRCFPHILPEISFVTLEGKNVLRIHIYRGSVPPYYVKEKGIEKGTYIRVGSNNRLADSTIIRELERVRNNISYDAEAVYDIPLCDLNYTSFSKLYLEKKGEPLDKQVLLKLELIKEIRGELYPTNALVLLSDDPERSSHFPYARIDFARFKGNDMQLFIDQKSSSGNLVQQIDEALDFVQRHTNLHGRTEEVFTIRRWEFPMEAIRELLRNAVIHRQYAFENADIKLAIFDDMIEISSPGLLPPNIVYENLLSQQSSPRNRIVARVFKHLGIIDQWGRGLKLIAEELQQYPEIALLYREAGLFFQVLLAKQNMIEAAQRDHYILVEIPQAPTSSYTELSVLEEAPAKFLHTPSNWELTNPLGQLTTRLSEDEKSILKLLSAEPNITIVNIVEALGIKQRTCERLIAQLKEKHLLARKGNNRTGYWEVVK